VTAVFKIGRFAAIAAFNLTSFASFGFAQSITGFGPAEAGEMQNQKLVAVRRATKSQVIAEAAQPRVIVFKGDTVISQFVDGGSWLTSITVTNLETHSTSFDVMFFKNDGTDFDVPIVGLSGLQRGVTVTLPPMGTLTFYTSGTNPFLTAGWALLSQTTNDSVGISAVFRQFVPGGQAQEAVVPAVNQYETHFALNFDDTAYITGLALANPTLDNVAVVANIRNSGGRLSIHEISLSRRSTISRFHCPLPGLQRRELVEQLSSLHLAMASVRSDFASMVPLSRLSMFSKTIIGS
jgi:hypothetical protein